MSDDELGFDPESGGVATLDQIEHRSGAGEEAGRIVSDLQIAGLVEANSRFSNTWVSLTPEGRRILTDWLRDEMIEGATQAAVTINAQRFAKMSKLLEELQAERDLLHAALTSLLNDREAYEVDVPWTDLGDGARRLLNLERDTDFAGRPLFRATLESTP